MTKYFYLRDKHHQPVGCVASKIDYNNRQVLYHISLLHDGDSFDKKVARDIACGRLTKEPLCIPFDDVGVLTAHMVNKAVMLKIAHNMVLGKDVCSSSKARSAAKRWLRDK